MPQFIITSVGRCKKKLICYCIVKLSNYRQKAQCPQCRKQNIKHFQLYFETEDDIQGAKCAELISIEGSSDVTKQQFNLIVKKLDELSLKMNLINRHGSSVKTDNEEVCDDLLKRNERLEKENADLKELHEMSTIVLTNTEKEIALLKEEISQRNDIINLLQLQNDNLRDEAKKLKMLGANAVRKEDLVTYLFHLAFL
jgi:chromosome segregation ATPase